ncbi:MFS transporter [Aquimarina celericrescens]|uniref:MFS transporter n=1 Tax=Aquimarina celericrescens TaxID=1964542 RepID=A0ABW5B079_9FLAO|nr:MFS transporter [Aquimarina celericrescens]
MNTIERLYDFINEEEDARICKDIDENACRYTPKNYFLILLSNIFTKLGDTLSNPKTVLAWVMSYVQAPVYLISFIVPIRESGSMLPQIIISSYIRKKEIRKWVWVLGSLLQFLSISAIGVVAMNFDGSKAGWLIIILLIVFSLSRGLCSISSKDVLGKTIPKTRRGKLKGYTVAVSGILVLFAGLFMIYKSKQEQNIEFYSSIIFFAGCMWLISAIVYANIKEFPGETSGGQNGLSEAIAKISILKTDPNFRNFIISRSLLLCSALTAPFYVLLAQTYLGKESYLLGLFILANGIASIVSAPIWGRMADVSSKKVMSIGAIITSVLGILIFLIISFFPVLRQQYWLYPIAFFVLGIAHNGVRLGRKTYILDMAGGNKRTDYVAVSNTLIGIILLITGGISALASIVSVEGVILALSLLGVAGAYKSSKLPNVE